VSLKALKIIAIAAVIAATLVVLGVALIYAMRPPPIVASGAADPLTIGTAVLLVGYFVFPVLGLLAADPGAVVPRHGQDWLAPASKILLGAAFLVVFYLTFTSLRAGDTMHIDVTPLSTAFAFCAGLAITAGAVVVLFLREGAVGARFSIAIGLLVFAMLAIFSVGLVILPVALVLFGFAIRQLVLRRSGQAVRAALAGGAVGVGAVAYLLVMIQPAAAECRVNGGGATSSGGLFGPTALSQGGFSMADGSSGGYIDEGDRIAYFSCRDGRLTDFHRETLPLGNWVVTTEPFATVGRTVMLVFRVRAAPGESVPADGFDFSVTCHTCAEPRPVVRAYAYRLGTRAPGTPGAAVTFAGQIAFPAAGSWYTSPYNGGIEVR
jgi:hypothetical protein